MDLYARHGPAGENRTRWKPLRASGRPCARVPGQEAEGSGTDGARDALGIPDGAARASFYLS